MNQIDLTSFLAALSPKDKVEAQQDIEELKKRIWERVGLPPVPNSQNQAL